jgi:hypothetical protein
MKRLLFLPLLATLLAGCAGYELGPKPPRAMADVQSIAVPMFENQTFEPRIEALITDTVISQLQQDGTYRVVRERDADAVLQAKIIELRRNKARSVRGNTLASSEFNLTLTVRYVVTRRSTGEELMRREAAGTTSFFISNDLQQDERQAIPLAAAKLAAELASQISEGW